MRVAVVGAGLGGLSAACHLAGSGHDVTVLDRAHDPGGRAGLDARSGYRFDTGPTVLTMTGILDDVFKSAGTTLRDHVDVRPVDPMYRACFPDGSEIHCRQGIEAMRAEIAATCGTKDADAFVRFSKWLTSLYELEMPSFIDRNFDKPLDLARPISPMVKLLRMGGLRKLSSVVESFFDDDRLRRLYSFQAMYAGLSPFDALAIYAVITYMDSVEGVYFPKGGMHAVSRGLAEAATAAGAKLQFDTEVDHVVRGDTGVTGVRLSDGQTLNVDAVVLNTDLPVAYRELLPGLSMPKVAARGTYSPSCLVWTAGVKGSLPDKTQHHNIHFGGQWRQAFDALLRDGRPMPDPSILTTVPTVTDPDLAPKDRHSLYVLEPMPNLDGRIDWKREGDERRQRLLRQVRKLGYPTNTDVETFTGPLEWQQQGMERGTPFALSHAFFQTGPFRPRNYDKRAPGVFFTGSGTTPGVGVPMVLLSGKHAAARVDEWARTR